MELHISATKQSAHKGSRLIKAGFFIVGAFHCACTLCFTRTKTSLQCHKAQVIKQQEWLLIVDSMATPS